jgi:hypothetical protein
LLRGHVRARLFDEIFHWRCGRAPRPFAEARTAGEAGFAVALD